MHRIDTKTAQKDKFGAGSADPRRGDFPVYLAAGGA